MAFSARFAKPKAAPAPTPAATQDEDSDEVESVEAEEDASARNAEAERLRKMKEAEQAAKAKQLEEAKQLAEAREKERKAAEDAARQKAATEAARRREAAEEARRKAEEDKRRREEYEYEKARQETIARSKREAAKRAMGPGGGGFGGGAGFGGGGGGGSFAWKKSGQQQGAGFGAGGAGPGKKVDPRQQDLPGHDECEMGISAMISRTSNGMKEGLQMLGLPNFPLTFVPGQSLQLCGHDVREGVNEMIHNWMTDEKDDFYACLLRLREITSKPILTQEEMEMMEQQEDWVQIDGPDGKPRFTKRDKGAKPDGAPAPKAAPNAPQAEEDSDDEVIDIVPGGPIPTSTPAPAAPAAARAAAAPPAAAAAGGEEDYYGLLGVAPNATLQEIRAKFRSLVVTEHPEKGGDPKKFQRLNKAYSVLSDPKKRQEHDAGRGPRPSRLVD